MEDRIRKTKQKISRDRIDALYITSPYNISYLTNLFPSNVEEREFYIFITKDNAYLLAPKMFLMSIQEKTDGFTYIEITAAKGLYKNLLAICTRENIKSVGFEEQNLLYKEFEHLHDALAGVELIPLEDFIEDERQIKKDDEIERIKKACEITDVCYEGVLDKIAAGVTEREIASGIEFYFNQFGGNAFRPIVAFGKNAAVPHHISDDTVLKRDSFVLLDFGAKFEGYCADMSRTVYFGNPSEEEKKMYRTVLESQEVAIAKLQEWQDKSFQASHLHEIAESHIEQNGYPQIPHSLGHGVGLQVHELPSISKYTQGNPLKKGIVITIEPGIYIPGVGGVRIEDDILLTEDGFEVLTQSRKQLTVIE